MPNANIYINGACKQGNGMVMILDKDKKYSPWRTCFDYLYAYVECG